MIRKKVRFSILVCFYSLLFVGSLYNEERFTFASPAIIPDDLFTNLILQALNVSLLSRVNKKTIRFRYHETPFRVKRAAWIKKHLATVMKSENQEFSEITYILSNDSFILGLNQEYLNHNYFTDILTFTLSQPEEPIISEIYISIDRVKENAKKFQQPLQRELYRVLIHGLLHLSGYNDHSEKEQKVMRQKEDFYINRMK